MLENEQQSARSRKIAQPGMGTAHPTGMRMQTDPAFMPPRFLCSFAAMDGVVLCIPARQASALCVPRASAVILVSGSWLYFFAPMFLPALLVSLAVGIGNVQKQDNAAFFNGPKPPNPAQSNRIKVNQTINS